MIGLAAVPDHPDAGARRRAGAAVPRWSGRNPRARARLCRNGRSAGHRPARGPARTRLRRRDRRHVRDADPGSARLPLPSSSIGLGPRGKGRSQRRPAGRHAGGGRTGRCRNGRGRAPRCRPGRRRRPGRSRGRVRRGAAARRLPLRPVPPSAASGRPAPRRDRGRARPGRRRGSRGDRGRPAARPARWRI